MTCVEEQPLVHLCPSAPPKGNFLIRSATGCGAVRVGRGARRSFVASAMSNSPLKLLTPRTNGSAAWIYTSTYGGGLVGGDSVSLDVEVGQNATCLLSTQASTKVYRTIGPACSQALDARIETGATLVCLPDPIVCFAGAVYEQRQRFDLASDASLVMLDWFTSGRYARGERWACSRYLSRTEIVVGDRSVLRDVILLDPADGPIDGPMRMGTCNCFATVVVIGPQMRLHVEQLLNDMAAQPAPSGRLLFSASPLDGGIVLRVAGSETEAVGRWVRERLGFVSDRLGQEPWGRKW
jgi:urease accessory protein